ncbi:MAG: type II secretion system protein [Planctomycetota bacterium]
MDTAYSRARRGFSLVEAMMSFMVLSIAIAAAFQVFFSSSRSSNLAIEFTNAHTAAETRLGWVRTVAMQDIEMAFRVYDGVSANDVRGEPPHYEGTILDKNPAMEPDYRIIDGFSFYTNSYNRDVENRHTKDIKFSGAVIGYFPALPPSHFYVNELPPLYNPAANNAIGYNASLSVPRLPHGEIILGARVPFNVSFQSKTHVVISEVPSLTTIAGQPILPFVDMNLDGTPEHFDWNYKSSINQNDINVADAFTERFYWDTAQGTISMIAGNAGYETTGSAHPDIANGTEWTIFSLPCAVRVSWTPTGGSKLLPQSITIRSEITDRSDDYPTQGQSF